MNVRLKCSTSFFSSALLRFNFASTARNSLFNCSDFFRRSVKSDTLLEESDKSRSYRMPTNSKVFLTDTQTLYAIDKSL